MVLVSSGLAVVFGLESVDVEKDYRGGRCQCNRISDRISDSIFGFDPTPFFHFFCLRRLGRR